MTILHFYPSLLSILVCIGWGVLVCPYLLVEVRDNNAFLLKPWSCVSGASTSVVFMNDLIKARALVSTRKLGSQGKRRA